MRNFLLLLLLSILPACADSFTEANRAYTAGDFKTALSGYESALHSEPAANVYFNLGNAAWRAEQPGRAALAYERALLADPAHPEALFNLQFIRGKAGSRVDERPWVEHALRFAAYPAATWLALSLGWLGFIFFIAALFLRSARWPRWLGALFLVLGLAAATGVQFGRRELTGVAIVTAKTTDARTEPADRATLAAALPAGSWVRVLSEQGNWTYCELPGGGRGWLDTKAIERLLPAGFS